MAKRKEKETHRGLNKSSKAKKLKCFPLLVVVRCILPHHPSDILEMVSYSVKNMVFPLLIKRNLS